MATNPSYSQKVIECRGRACAKCGRCRDWYWNPTDKTKHYTKRPDAICTASYSYGNLGYGPGCLGYVLCCVACIPFVKCCVQQYYGGDGYSHGSGIPLNGFLNGGLKDNIATLAGVDVNARNERRINAGVADIFTGGVASLANDMAEMNDGTMRERIRLARAHHDLGRLCECDDNQQ